MILRFHGIFLISQNVVTGYDTYSDAVVVAESAEVARRMHPNEGTDRAVDWLYLLDETGWWYRYTWDNDGDDWYEDRSWARNPRDVTVRFLGWAKLNLEAGFVCRSFHAG